MVRITCRLGLLLTQGLQSVSHENGCLELETLCAEVECWIPRKIRINVLLYHKCACMCMCVCMCAPMCEMWVLPPLGTEWGFFCLLLPARCPSLSASFPDVYGPLLLGKCIFSSDLVLWLKLASMGNPFDIATQHCLQNSHPRTTQLSHTHTKAPNIS